MLRAIPKVGTRSKQWLIVNDAGGLVEEFTGEQRQADDRAKFLNERREGQAVMRRIRRENS